jgi:restriction system protein
MNMRRSSDRAAREMFRLPWWVFLALAPLIYLGLGYGLPAVGGPLLRGNPLMPLAPFAAGSLIVLSILFAIYQHRSGRLLDQQTNIDSIRAMPWRSFETLVAEAYRRQGYSVVNNGGGGADGGVDLLARKDGTYLIQCKHWKTYRVGVKEIRELFGILVSEHAKGGILVTTGTFTPDALAFAKGKPIELVDGTRVAEMVRSVQQPRRAARPTADAPSIGKATDVMARADPRCPQCQEPMVRRTAQRGANPGKAFWGCTAYPRCKGTIDIRS